MIDVSKRSNYDQDSYFECEKILDIINSVKDKNVPHKAKDGEQ